MSKFHYAGTQITLFSAHCKFIMNIIAVPMDTPFKYYIIAKKKFYFVFEWEIAFLIQIFCLKKETLQIYNENICNRFFYV